MGSPWSPVTASGFFGTHSWWNSLVFITVVPINWFIVYIRRSWAFSYFPRWTHFRLLACCGTEKREDKAFWHYAEAKWNHSPSNCSNILLRIARHPLEHPVISLRVLHPAANQTDFCFPCDDASNVEIPLPRIPSLLFKLSTHSANEMTSRTFPPYHLIYCKTGLSSSSSQNETSRELKRKSLWALGLAH